MMKVEIIIQNLNGKDVGNICAEKWTSEKSFSGDISEKDNLKNELKNYANELAKKSNKVFGSKENHESDKYYIKLFSKARNS